MELDHPFGFVAGRWVFATADTAGDPDRGPDYVPASGATITFTPETPRIVVPDTPGWTGVINKRVVGKLNEDGRLVDAEGHNHLALGMGTYAVHYYFGNDIKWPSHRIQVTEAHTASNPLWLPPMPAPPDVPDAVNRTIQVPADGTDGQVLVWDGVGFSWDFPPTGPQGPKGDSDVEQLVGAPRLTNLVHDITWIATNSTIDSQEDRTVKFTATAQNGSIRWSEYMGRKTYYVSAEVKATGSQVLFGSAGAPTYHSGSGDWERLTARITPTGTTPYMVSDRRSSGWDQIELRDPVLIDLTAVFGAGREPSREYMDALLAKHGGYIGAVDQFAVGDALQALTVAGPGLALRLDTSVGTRVILDHPGGSVMLHGDTGWRTLTSWDTTGNVTGRPLPDNLIPTPGKAGNIRVRRIGSRVYWRIIGYTMTAIVLFVDAHIPAGYKGEPDSAIIPTILDTSGTHGWVRVTGWGFSLSASSYPRVGPHNSPTVFDYFAPDPWPTTLPGLPA